MIKVLTGTQMRKIDQKTIVDLGIPGLILMENAGLAVYDQILDIIENIKSEFVSVLVICGKGNNGGDGFVAARHLIEDNIQTTVVSLYQEQELSGDAFINHNILKNFTEIIYYDQIDLNTLETLISESTIIVDAIFGTGLSSDIKGYLKDIIDSINKFSEDFVVSVDIPSGIDANTGRILGTAVLSDYTVSFFAPKLGMIFFPGAEFAGQITVSDIGIPKHLLKDNEYNINLITPHLVALSIPLRPENSNKGTFGSVFNVAGSFGMSGAAYLSSYSSLKVGAGYSMLATAESIVNTISVLAPEIVLIPLKETSDKAISVESLPYALDRSNKANAFLIGPGLGTGESTKEFVSGFIKELTDRGLPTLIDADGLNCLSTKEHISIPVNSVITPHAKELARLMKVSVEEILYDRIKAAREAALRFNTTVVLKGARTIISEPNGTIYINSTGNSALATAGTGDVLSGMIAGFMAQGLTIRDAAIARGAICTD